MQVSRYISQRTSERASGRPAWCQTHGKLSRKRRETARRAARVAGARSGADSGGRGTRGLARRDWLATAADQTGRGILTPDPYRSSLFRSPPQTLKQFPTCIKSYSVLLDTNTQKDEEQTKNDVKQSLIGERSQEQRVRTRSQLPGARGRAGVITRQVCGNLSLPLLSFSTKLRKHSFLPY